MITSLEDKKGGIRRQDPDMDMFREAISELKMVDLQTKNGTFTWNNQRGGQNYIASRLDHFLVSEQVISIDIYMETSILPGMGLEH